MTQANDTTRVFIPLTQRRRNGRPRVLPPEQGSQFQFRSQDPHILRALGRAWAWGRRLETGEAAPIHDIDKAENLSDRFVGRIMRLAYLSPKVVQAILDGSHPAWLTMRDLLEPFPMDWQLQEKKFLARFEESNLTSEY